MKILRSTGMVIILLLLSSVSCWAQSSDEERLSNIILDDKARGTSIVLEPLPEGHPWRDSVYRYYNEKYTYTALVSIDVAKVLLLPDNGDGFILENDDSSKRLRASAGFAEFLGSDMTSIFCEAIKKYPSLTSAQLVQERAGTGDVLESYFILSWEEADTMHYRKFEVKEEYWFDYEYSHKKSDKYDALKDYILEESGLPKG